MQLRLPRTKLVARILEHRGPVVIVAPRGFGKSSLLGLLREQAGYVARPDVSWLHHEIDLVVDSAFGIPPSLGAAISEHIPLVLSSRTVEPIEDIADHPDVLFLDYSALVYDIDEIAQLAESCFGAELGQKLSHILLPATGGWPLLVNTHLESLQGAKLLASEVLAKAVERTDKNEAVGRVLRPIVRPLSRDEVITLSTLAHVRSFPEASAVDAGGSEFLARVRNLGLPLVSNSDGRLEFFPVVGEYFRSQHASDPTTVKRIVPSLLACDAAMQATRVLLSIGQLDEAALVVKDLKRRDLETVNPIDFVGVLSMLEDVADQWPELRLQHARILRRMGNQAEAIAILEQLLSQDHRLEFAWEVEAEYLFHVASDNSTPELLRRIDELLLTVPTKEFATRAMLQMAKGVSLALSSNLPEICESEAALLLAARQWESLGETHFAARTLRLLASTTLSELGRFTDVRRVLERSMELAGGQATNRLLVVALLGRVAALSGDLEAFELYDAELEGLAAGGSLDWPRGYVQWSRMMASAWRRDPASVGAHFERAGRLLVGFRDDRTGAAFLAEAAEAHARVGLSSVAKDLFEQARAHPQSTERMIKLASVAVAATTENYETVKDIVESALADGIIPPSLRWRVLLHVAYAAKRCNGSVDSDLLNMVELEADVVGDTKWPRLLAKELWTAPQLEPTRLRSSVISEKAVAPVSVEVLGGFAIRRYDNVITPSPGHVATLLKLLSVRGGCVPVEIAIDQLWPDVDVDTGRRRLKNVLSRLRKEVGEGTVVRSDQSIAFGMNVFLDVNEFDQRARKAMVSSASHSPEAFTSACAALDVYRGALLPMDLYEDWIEETRTYLQARAFALLDLVRASASEALRPWLTETSLRVSNLEAVCSS
jgi:tetratricopeptide (TPR) repeat protein